MQANVKIANETRTVWIIDPTHTTVEFAVRKFFLFTVKGSIGTADGTITVDPADIRGSSVTATLTSASIVTGNKRRDTHLRASDFLEADKYPEIRFQSSKVEPGTDRDTLRVHGLLTIKNKSVEVILNVNDIDRSCSPSGEQVAYYTALVEVDRHDFGVDAWRSLIGSKVQITINVQAIRQM